MSSEPDSTSMAELAVRGAEVAASRELRSAHNKGHGGAQWRMAELDGLE
jgi:hypothetical protein